MNQVRRLLPFRISHPTISGLWYAYLWMMIGALLLSLLLRFSALEEQDLTLYTYIVHAVSLIFGGFVSGKRTGRKGWLQGGMTGVYYSALLIIISFLALDSSLTIKALLIIIPAFIIGALGGMFGVNVSRAR